MNEHMQLLTHTKLEQWATSYCTMHLISNLNNTSWTHHQRS